MNMNGMEDDKPPPAESDLRRTAPARVRFGIDNRRASWFREMVNVCRLSSPGLSSRLRDDIPLLALNGFNH